MKKILIIALSAFIGASALVGCRTTSNPSGVVVVNGVTIDPNSTAEIVRITAKLGGIATINSKPETRPYFLQASAAISVAAITGTTSPTQISEILSNITDDVIVRSSVEDAIQLYSAYFGNLVTNRLDTYSPYTVPVLTGLATGLKQAYDLTPAQ